MHSEKRRARITARGFKDKTTVMGILERGGKVRLAHVPNRHKQHVQGHIKAHVATESALYTDALLSYDGLRRDFAHKVIDHAGKYVDGRIHTNGLENFWSLLKRGIGGTYISVEPFHLFRYLDEQSFRYNNRMDMNDGDRFVEAVKHIVGRRVTYEQLTRNRHRTPRRGRAEAIVRWPNPCLSLVFSLSSLQVQLSSLGRAQSWCVQIYRAL